MTEKKSLFGFISIGLLILGFSIENERDYDGGIGKFVLNVIFLGRDLGVFELGSGTGGGRRKVELSRHFGKGLLEIDILRCDLLGNII